MVDQAASRPTASSASNTAPSMRVDLREETVTETATPGAPGLGQRMSLDLGQTMKMRGMGDLGQVCALHAGHIVGAVTLLSHANEYWE